LATLTTPETVPLDDQPDDLEPWEKEAGVWIDTDGNPNIGNRPEAK